MTKESKKAPSVKKRGAPAPARSSKAKEVKGMPGAPKSAPAVPRRAPVRAARPRAGSAVADPGAAALAAELALDPAASKKQRRAAEREAAATAAAEAAARSAAAKAVTQHRGAPSKFDKARKASGVDLDEVLVTALEKHRPVGGKAQTSWQRVADDLNAAMPKTVQAQFKFDVQYVIARHHRFLKKGLHERDAGLFSAVKPF